MNYEDFADRLRKLSKGSLPGIVAHQQMLPQHSRSSAPLHKEKAVRESAVLVLFYPEAGDFYMPVIRRAFDGKKHSGQIAFPGGKYEPEDKTLITTALREAQEEVGIEPEKVEVLKKMTPVYIPVSNYQVQPILGITNQKPDFHPNFSEVDTIFSLNVSDFLNVKPVTKNFILGDKNLTAPFYILGEVEIWGATAMIMSELKEILKEIFKDGV